MNIVKNFTLSIFNNTVIDNLINAFKNRVLDDNGVFENENSLESFIENTPTNMLSVTPNGVNTNKIYSYKGQDLSFERNTTATRINSDGLIEEVGVNVPRLDYSTGEPSIIIQPQRTNLFGNNSPDLGYLAPGVRVEVNDWGIGFDKKVILDNNDGMFNSSYSFSTPSIIEGEVYTSFAFVRNQDGSEVVTSVSNYTGSSFYLILNGTIPQNSIYINTSLFKDDIYLVIMVAVAGDNISLNGARKRSGQNPVPTEISGLTIIEGDHRNLSLIDVIKTTGSIATRNADIATFTDYNTPKGKVIKIDNEFILDIDSEKDTLNEGRTEFEYHINELLNNNYDKLWYGTNKNIANVDFENSTLFLASGKENVAGKIKSIIGQDLDFERNTTATRINSDGLIEEVGVNVPRLDYSTGEGALLFEPQRTNIIELSVDYSQWDGIRGLEVLSTTELAPDGTNTATKVKGIDGVLFTRLRNRNVPISSDGVYTFSVWAKSDNPGVFTNGEILQLVGTTEGNLSTSQLTTEWKRYSVQAECTGTVDYILSSQINDDAEMYLWGAQLEEGEFATSYIPTNGSIATRNVDNIGIKIFPNTLIEKGDDFEVNMEAELLNPEANDLYGRGGSILFSLFEDGIRAFNNQITLCRRSEQFFIKCRSSASGIDVNYLTAINFNANQKYKIKFEYNNAGGVKLTIDDTEVFENTDTLPELKINKGLFTAYDNTTPQSKIYNFSIKNK